MNTFSVVCFLLFSFYVSSTYCQSCIGPYQLCDSGACALSNNSCNVCTSGQYVCPIGQSTCVDSVDDYVKCPGLAGTHLDWNLPLDTRVEFLISNLSLYEKYTQLTNDAPEIFRLGIPSYNWLNDDLHGVRQPHQTTFPDGCGLGSTWSKEDIKQVGNIIGYEARALYNANTEQGNRGKNENGYTISVYGPNINIVRDPRWGRSQEVYGEDPLLTARLSKEIVEGIQIGNMENNTYMLVAACCKHFAAYDIESIPTSRFLFNAIVDGRNWFETYSPAFFSCVNTAQAAHVMCSYNEINGIPACGNRDLLTNVLRNQWNFTGFVVSDYDAMAQIYSTHKYASSYEEAVAIGLKAGCDQEGGGTNAINQIPAAINDSLLNITTINTAFSRLFKIRFKLGLFDPPTFVKYNYLTNDSTVEGSAHLSFAREVAAKSIGLYKNNNMNSTNSPALPLDSSNINKIALIGLQAVSTDLLLGNYATYPDKGVIPIVEAFREELGENKTIAKCTYLDNIDYYQPGQSGVQVYSAEQCCNLCFQNDECNYWTVYESQCFMKYNDTGKTNSNGRISGQCENSATLNGTSKIIYTGGCNEILCQNGIEYDKIGAVVKDNINVLDAVMVCVGLDQNVESEGKDRSTIDLPGNQSQVVGYVRELIDQSGKGDSVPLVCVLIHGGIVALKPIVEQCDVILDAWYPGMMGAYGISDVVFGKYNPAGRATVTYYDSNDDLPKPGAMNLYPNNNNTNGVTYRYYKGSNTPTFPFGYGLSYTSFEYSNLVIDKTEYTGCEEIKLSVTVTNTGDYDGDEVIQCYISQPYATVPVPNIRLADFHRVNIVKGESVKVNMTITPRYHSVVYNTSTSNWWNPMVYIETGNINIYVGGGQPKYFVNNLNTTVSITSKMPLDMCDNQD